MRLKSEVAAAAAKTGNEEGQQAKGAPQVMMARRHYRSDHYTQRKKAYKREVKNSRSEYKGERRERDSRSTTAGGRGCFDNEQRGVITSLIDEVWARVIGAHRSGTDTKATHHVIDTHLADPGFEVQFARLCGLQTEVAQRYSDPEDTGKADRAPVGLDSGFWRRCGGVQGVQRPQRESRSSGIDVRGLQPNKDRHRTGIIHLGNHWN